MKLITERNLLYAYTPMDIHNPHKSKLIMPYTDEHIGTTVYEGVWGASEYMMIDIIADLTRSSGYKDKKPGTKDIKANISHRNPTKVESDYVGDKKFDVKFGCRFSHGQIVTRYPFLRVYTPKQLHGLFRKAAQILLTCKYRYKICERNEVTIGDRTKIKETIAKYDFQPQTPQRLFDFDYNQDDQSYLFKFTSGLAVLFFNNILATEWEWVPSELYSLCKNSQNLYRKILLVRKKGTELYVPCIEIAKMLNITTPNQTARRKSIEGYLKELEAKGFLKFRVERGYRDFVFRLEKTISN